MIWFWWMRDWCQHRCVGKHCSNSELSFNIANFLRTKGRVETRNMGDATPPEVRETDLLVGHMGPWAKGSPSPWVYVITPWPGVSDSWYRYWFKDEKWIVSLRKAKHIFGLCGGHQIELTKADPIQSAFKDKLSPLDMGLDRSMYPFIKPRFNQKGERGFYYLGNPHPAKNVMAMIRAAEATGSTLILADGRTNQFGRVHEIGWVQNGDAGLWRFIAEKCDFYLAVPTIDCQPVSPIEAASRGFIPIVSPAASFACPDAVQVGTSVDEIAAKMNQLQQLEEEELRRRQFACMRYIEQAHTWQKFLETIWSKIESDGYEVEMQNVESETN